MAGGMRDIGTPGECRLCNISAAECPECMDGPYENGGTTDDF